MTLTMEIKANVRVFEDSSKKSPRFAPDDTLAATQATVFQREQSGDIEVATGNELVLSLGSVSSVRGVLVRVDQACTLRVNGSADGVLLTPSATGEPARYLAEAVLTEVKIVADQGQDVSGSYCVWGDPTP